MADEQNLNENQMDLLKKLAAIGSDLWGGMPSAAYEKEEVPDKQKVLLQTLDMMLHRQIMIQTIL